MAFADTFTTTAKVMRQENSQGDTGAMKEKWQEAAKVLCRITTTSLSERAVQMREGVVSTHVILCDGGEDIRSRDQLWVTVGNIVEKYLVNTVDPIDIWATTHHLRIQATKTE